MYLIVDTETTGLPPDWNLPARATNNWPRIVQVAWITIDVAGTAAPMQTRLIKPSGFQIPLEATRVHGITTADALDRGLELKPVLDEILIEVQHASVVVAHNIAFDIPVLAAEFIRAGFINPFTRKATLCTMKGSANHCRIPGRYDDYKWPSLIELHTALFGSAFDGAHDAGRDCMACLKCFLRLRELGVMR